MKKIAGLLAVLALAVLSPALFLTGCTDTREPHFDIDAVYSFRRLPGITPAEIAAVETIQSERSRLNFGICTSVGSFDQYETGYYAGFHIRVVRHLANLFGVNFNISVYPSWEELIDALKNNEVDFIGEISPISAAKYGFYVTEPISDPPQRLFLRADNGTIHSEEDLFGKNIGFFTHGASEEIIRTRYPGAGFRSVHIDTTETAQAMLRSGEIDGFITSSNLDPVFLVHDDIVNLPVYPLAFIPTAIATADPGLRVMIDITNRYINAGGIDKMYAMYREGVVEYNVYKLQKQLTQEERDYITYRKNNRLAIPVAMLRDYYPICFYDEKLQSFQGIAPDTLAEISTLTGLIFDSVSGERTTVAEMQQQVLQDDIPMTAFLLRSEHRISEFDWPDVPYARSYYAILSRQEMGQTSFYQILRSRVGVVNQSAYMLLFNDIFPGHEQLRLYDDQFEALDALERGDIDLLMASEYILMLQANYRQKTGYKVNYRFAGIPHDAYFGFNYNEQVLRSIVNKAMPYVNTEDITMQWSNRLFDYSQQLSAQRITMLIIFSAVSMVGFAYVTLLLIKNRRLNKSLTEKAFIDHLTGILNRRYFMERTLEEMDRASRQGADSFIIIMDLDHFKNINDTYGHLVGDAVLQAATRRIKQAIRPYDLFGRYGGEEFILFITDVNKTAIRNMAERMRQMLSNAPILYGDLEISVTASFGISFATPKHDLDLATRLADEALYKAKSTGRNRVIFG